MGKYPAPLTRDDLEGAQIGAAARIADVAKHYPDFANANLEIPEARRVVTEAAVERAVAVIRASEDYAACRVPVRAPDLPDLSDFE